MKSIILYLESDEKPRLRDRVKGHLKRHKGKYAAGAAALGAAALSARPISKHLVQKDSKYRWRFSEKNTRENLDQAIEDAKHNPHRQTWQIINPYRKPEDPLTDGDVRISRTKPRVSKFTERLAGSQSGSQPDYKPVLIRGDSK